MTDALKPCPFCGTTVHRFIGKICHIKTVKCVKGPFDGSDEEWNTRAPDPRIAQLEAECERLRKDAERIRQEERAIAVSDCVATALMTPRSECPDIPEHRGREFERGYFYSRGASDVEQNLASAFERLYFDRPAHLGSRENAYKEARRRDKENIYKEAAIKESER